MPLNIKNFAVESLAADVAALAGETKTEAIRKSLELRKRALEHERSASEQRGGLLAALVHEIWPVVPADQLGKRFTHSEEDDIFGYDADGA